MTSEEVRWESGSEFHWLQKDCCGLEPTVPDRALLYSCGRTAMASLLDFGMKELGWKRLWIPTYYCPEVVDTITATNIKICVYPDNPFDRAELPSMFESGDVVLVVNFFGLKNASEYEALFQAKVPIIEDHSHDPWSQWAQQSRADYVVVSLRKTLPIPDGGAIWSKTNAPVPQSPPMAGCNSPGVFEKLEAMLMKSVYLNGGNIDKNEYLPLFQKSADTLAQNTAEPTLRILGISKISAVVLRGFPWKEWRGQRQKNCSYLRDKIAEEKIKGVEIFGSNSSVICPFSLLVLFNDPAKRDRIKQRLMDQSVYPAVIWPLDHKRFWWTDERSCNLSARMLSLHCDGRYAQADMGKVAEIFYASCL